MEWQLLSHTGVLILVMNYCFSMLWDKSSKVYQPGDRYSVITNMITKAMNGLLEWKLNVCGDQSPEHNGSTTNYS